jgi:hypothetical protein
MLDSIDQIKEKTGLSYQLICEALRLPFGSFNRWRMRRTRLSPAVRQPGPQKIMSPDFSRLREDMGRLHHGIKRTHGAGVLYARYAPCLSRRNLQHFVSMARHDLNAQHRQNLRRIHWNIPNVAWSIDMTEYEQRDTGGAKLYLNQMQDLASRYKFSPMVGPLFCGEEIAGYVAQKFYRFNAPLILKLDNGGNLNHSAVYDVLHEYFVLPLNSPVKYPPYNGAIEEAQKELKAALGARLAHRSCCPREHMEAYAEAVEHDLNHRPRPCLKGKNACRAFFSNRRSFTKQERREAYDWITNLQNNILCSEGVRPQSAWRTAVEAWLNMKGFITITINGKVLPSFF